MSSKLDHVGGAKAIALPARQPENHQIPNETTKLPVGYLQLEDTGRTGTAVLRH